MLTLKKQCLYLHRFASLEEARRIIGKFIARYSAEWIVERLGYQTPAAADEWRRRPDHDRQSETGSLGGTRIDDRRGVAISVLPKSAVLDRVTRHAGVQETGCGTRVP